MASQRVRRVQKLLRAAIAEIIQRKLKDPRVGLVTVTRVDVSPDLRNAGVFISLVREDESEEEALSGLRSAAGFIRAELMNELHLRPMPVLEFTIDRALHEGARTLDLLDRIRHEHTDDTRGPGPGGSADSEQ